jgi:NADPH-dependent 2,4-dienoyl-CoA reductase/sulfur reductase-like enzyme
MNRRGFLSLSAFTPLAHLLPAYARDFRAPARDLKADVVIIGAGVGGVACALAAARNGLKVILTEEYDWIGGQLTSQAVPPDEHPWVEDRGSTKTYRQFRTKVRDFLPQQLPTHRGGGEEPALEPG